jgi:tripartite-type tricarboxylate transporter receptor subunit TctC
LPTLRKLLFSLIPTLTIAAGAHAQEFPSKTVRLINPYSPGASSDVMARLLSERLSAALKTPVIVENRPGAGSAIGVNAVAQSPADGHTLLFCNSGPLVTAPLVTKTPFDPQKDLLPVTQIAYNVMILVVHTQSAGALKELVGEARAQPGKLSYACIGNGSLLHIAGETLKKLAGIDIVHVPYKGTVPAITDVLSRQVTMAFSDLIATKPHIEAGTLRALAISGHKRWPATPDVPLFGEQGYPALDRFTGWWGVSAPAGTPSATVDHISAAFNEALRDPNIRKRIEGANAEPTGTTPAEFAQIVRADLARWSALLKDLGTVRMD